MVSWLKREKLKVKAPQIVAVTVAVLVILYLLFDFLEDMILEGSSFTQALAGTPLAALLNVAIMITKGATATVSSLGYFGIFLLMFLESTSLPIPSEVILPFSGYLVSSGQLNYWIALLVSTAAGTAGCLVDYYIGMKGLDFLARRKTLSDLFYNQGRLATAQNWFNKYGATAVFLSRMAPGFRTLVSFPAGAVRMPLAKFIAYTTVGCLFWDAALIYVGFYVGSNWREVAGVAQYLIVGAAIIAAVAVIVLVFQKKEMPKKEKLKSDATFNSRYYLK